jgi:hypothetical protein
MTLNHERLQDKVTSLLSVPNLRDEIREADFNFRACQRLCTLAARRISAIPALKFCLVPVNHDRISHCFRYKGQRSATEFLRPCVDGWHWFLSLSSHLSSSRSSDDRRPTGPPCSLKLRQPHRVSLQDALTIHGRESCQLFFKIG